jgi:hypothetical protein
MAQVGDTQMSRIKDAFNRIYVGPLMAELDQTIVEFYGTLQEATARRDQGVNAVTDMVENVASKLTKYKQVRNVFKTTPLTVDNRNLQENAMPFGDDEAGNNRFKQLVVCCYDIPTVKDCSLYQAKSGYYAVYEKKNPENACIEAIITDIIRSFPVPQDPKCAEYADLLAAQQAQVQAGGRRARIRTRRRKNQRR